MTISSTKRSRSSRRACGPLDSEEVTDLSDLVEAAEPNPLMRQVDALCGRADWDGLIDLAARCRAAVERGKQLWPIAEFIDYRLALEAPGPIAGAVITPQAGRFALGPLAEVAASSHRFEEAARYIASPQSRSAFAGECVVRGEDLTGLVDGESAQMIELPLRLAEWEPRYCLAKYRSNEVQVEEPALPKKLGAVSSAAGAPSEDPELVQALWDLVSVWVSDSNGHAEVSFVDGDAANAVAGLGSGEFRMARLKPADAMRYMAWAAASGGANGRRRGAALGRSRAWWAASRLVQLEWPVDPDVLGRSIAELDWFAFETGGGSSGWTLRLAVEDSRDAWAVAIDATDLR